MRVAAWGANPGWSSYYSILKTVERADGDPEEGAGHPRRVLRESCRRRPEHRSHRQEEVLPVTGTAPGLRDRAPAPAAAGVIGKLSTLDRFLAVWILAAMVVGLAVWWLGWWCLLRCLSWCSFRRLFSCVK
jgi:hypothetical protein